jgi:hypothetical protein
MKQSQAELQAHLREQVGFLIASVTALHQGQAAEAKRMAAVVRLLVHDTRRSRSLLRQLSIKSSILFYDTAGSVTDPGIASALNLAGMVLTVGHAGPRAFWIPVLDPGSDDTKCMARPFHSWWTRPVLKDTRSAFFSRKSIVMGVADQDGGAHVDPELDEAYAWLTRGSSIGWRMDIGNGLEEMPGLELACVRQVVHELLVSLACQSSHAFPSQAPADAYATCLMGTKGGSLEMEIGGLRPPFATLPREPLDSRMGSRQPGRNEECPCGSGEKFKHCHGL